MSGRVGLRPPQASVPVHTVGPTLPLHLILCCQWWTDLESILGFSLEHCLMRVWPKTDLFCGGSHGIPVNQRLRVDKDYGRVDRAVR
jgi:hypothetical protein